MALILLCFSVCRPGTTGANLINLGTTTKSIEEIATTILQEIRPERLIY